MTTTSANNKATAESQLRKVIEDHVNAVRAKDINGSMSHYAPDVVSFDVVNTLQKIGLEACRKRAEEWFSSFESVPFYMDGSAKAALDLKP